MAQRERRYKYLGTLRPAGIYQHHGAVTTDLDLGERPVVFAAGELEPAPIPRGRQQLIVRLALIVLAGVTALGALAAVASWSVTGSVGSTDPPKSLWYLPPAATDEAINLSDNHPAPLAIPTSAVVPVETSSAGHPTGTSSEDTPSVGGSDVGDDHGGHGGPGADDSGAVSSDGSGSSGSGGSGGSSGSGESGSGGSGSGGSGSGRNGADDGLSTSGGADDNAGRAVDDNPGQNSGGSGADNAVSGPTGGADDSPSVAEETGASVQAPSPDDSTSGGNSGSGASGSGGSGGGGSGSGGSGSGGSDTDSSGRHSGDDGSATG